MARATLFRNALVALYMAVGLLALAGILGAFAAFAFKGAFWIVMGATMLGTFAVLYAAITLIRESVVSLNIIKEHSKGIGQ